MSGPRTKRGKDAVSVACYARERVRSIAPVIDIRTHVSEDAASRQSSARLPTIVGEGLVGLGHAVDVVLALVGAALLGLGI